MKRPKWRAAALILGAMMLAMVAITPTAVDAAPSSAGDADSVDVVRGTGQSYWGLIPAAEDSVETAYLGLKTPTWEHVVNVPFYILRVPVGAVFGAAGLVTRWADRSGVARTINNLVSKQTLPYGFALSFTGGDLTGFGLGVTFEHREVFSPHNRARVTIKGSERDHRRANVGLAFGWLQPSQFEIGVGIREEPNARYFGIGPNSQAEDKSFYNQRMSWAGVAFRQKIVGRFYVKPDVIYTEVLADDPPNDSPSIPQQFPDSIPTGYGDNSLGLIAGVALEHDNATETGRPERGGYRRLYAAYFTNRDTDLNYWSYRLELQQFVPLWFTKRALALRFYYSDIDIGTDDLPFQRMMVNDDPDILRGYKDFRFRDRGMTALSAEYRWPVWSSSTIDGPGLDAYLFSDVGQVFQDPEQIKRQNLTASFGAGFRFVSLHGFVGRIEWSFSEEGSVFRLRTDQLFQFQTGGLYHGRKPVPSR